MVIISRFLLWLMGWKIRHDLPEGLKKAVIIAAPHTSNMDYIIGRLAYFVIGVNVKFLIKKEVFVWPVGRIFRAWGGIPIDRSKKNRMVDYVVELFNKSKQLFVVITPEATRKPVKSWKKGFYHIARLANVPIILGYLDYPKKEGGLGPLLYPTGNYEEDFKKIAAFYKGKTGRHPERFVLKETDNNY